MTPDVIGYVASSMVFAAYCTKEMISLRITAICSNVAFIAYGLSLGLAPIWALHAALLPLNGWRLAQAIACKRAAGRQLPETASAVGIIALADVSRTTPEGPSMEFGTIQRSSQPDQIDFSKLSFGRLDTIRRKAG